MKNISKILIERDRTRTCNPQIRSLVPYPLGHTPSYKFCVKFQNITSDCFNLNCNSHEDRIRMTLTDFLTHNTHVTTPNTDQIDQSVIHQKMA